MLTKNRRSLCMLLGLAISIACGHPDCTVGMDDATTENDKSGQNQKEENGERVSITVCPVYWYAQHEEYWSYYALRCNNGTQIGACSLDSAPNLPQRHCGDPDCIPTFLREGEIGHAVHEEYATEGLKKKPGENKLKLHKTSKLLSRHIVDVMIDDGSGSFFRAELYLILAKPKVQGRKLPNQIFAIGHEIEIDPDKKADFELTSQDVVANPSGALHCCLINIGNVTYQVITHRDTVLP